MAVSELEEADLLRCLEAEKARLRVLDAQIKQLSASRLAARQTVATYQRELVSHRPTDRMQYHSDLSGHCRRSGPAGIADGQQTGPPRRIPAKSLVQRPLGGR